MVKEERYCGKVDKLVDKKFEKLKMESFGGSVSYKPSAPVIPYLLKDNQEEEKKEVQPQKPKPVGFIGLEDNDDPIGGFIPKRGIGGSVKEQERSGIGDQVWNDDLLGFNKQKEEDDMFGASASTDEPFSFQDAFKPDQAFLQVLKENKKAEEKRKRTISG